MAAQLAVPLVADPALNDSEIAKRLSVTPRAVKKWKAHPDFAGAVATHVADAVAKLHAKGIADKQNRIDAYNDRWQRLQQIITARAASGMAADVPGGDTGLIVPTPMLLKLYDAVPDVYGDVDDELLTPAGTTRTVYTYAIDTALLKELRELEKQAAMEMGQWTDAEATGGNGRVTIQIATGFLLPPVAADTRPPVVQIEAAP